ncbi:DUF262 domain-containing protein [Flavobacterium tyrosinilyticum]|uniref:DUF262 domain-containing protein n=1 Tax=Flavobacterium tyrosinilyticum TaxID=1658740 RepID=UPI00202F52B2|nr:DUF262 domain-containing protein [Flavobacterium tyrosinilyticum]MCM0666398.1 DUF262 domain-containing protein [Flavobacterium tyrosinilyticum]
MNELEEIYEVDKKETTNDNNTSKVLPDIIDVATLLSYSNIKFPIYQRPYKWETKNVIQLIDDIIVHKDKSAYRLGTIVIHQEKNNKTNIVEYNIVDGQQRTITLILITKAIIKAVEKDEIIIQNKVLKEQIGSIKNKMVVPSFKNEISITNIQNNYREIERLVASIDEETISFLFNKCQFIKFVLSDVSEAFQFFDSQNARGKDLDPHDLLKAYHLREFGESEEQQKSKVISTWENMETNELVSLFGEYLFRVKSWSKGNSARFFTKNETNLFKGITIGKIENYPHTKPLCISHFYVDGYNQHNDRNVDLNLMEFPFQLDQTVINGRRFFEMITHYKRVLDDYKNTLANHPDLDTKARDIIYVMENYDGRGRIGDKYIRMMFDCSLIYYIDKFGNIELSRAIEKFFIWAYSLRLRHQAVYLASVDNYVVDEINVFKLMKDATTPFSILSMYLPPVETVNASKMELSGNHEGNPKGIKELFTTLKYYYAQ